MDANSPRAARSKAWRSFSRESHHALLNPSSARAFIERRRTLVQDQLTFEAYKSDKCRLFRLSRAAHRPNTVLRSVVLALHSYVGPKKAQEAGLTGWWKIIGVLLILGTHPSWAKGDAEDEITKVGSGPILPESDSQITIHQTVTALEQKFDFLSPQEAFELAMNVLSDRKQSMRDRQSAARELSNLRHRFLQTGSPLMADTVSRYARTFLDYDDAFIRGMAVLASQTKTGSLDRKSQRVAAELLAGDYVGPSLRKQLVKSFGESRIVDAGTALELLKARAYEGNSEVFGGLDYLLREATGMALLVTDANGRQNIQKSLVAIANNKSQPKPIREVAIALLNATGAPLWARDAVRNTNELYAWEKNDLYSSDENRGLFSSTWLKEQPDLEGLRFQVRREKKQKSPDAVVSGLITLLYHRNPQVREEAEKLIEETLRAHGANALPMSAGNSYRLRGAFSRNGAGAFLAYRYAGTEAQLESLVTGAGLRRGNGRLQAEIARAQKMGDPPFLVRVAPETRFEDRVDPWLTRPAVPYECEVATIKIARSRWRPVAAAAVAAGVAATAGTVYVYSGDDTKTPSPSALGSRKPKKKPEPGRIPVPEIAP